MTESLLAHRFHRIATVVEGSPRLDLARDVAGEDEGVALTLTGREASGLETLVRVRLELFGDRPLVRPVRVRVAVAGEHGLTLFLDTPLGEPWEDAARAASPDTLRTWLTELETGLDRWREDRPPVAALSLGALRVDDDGPFFLPTAYAASPDLDHPGAILPQLEDPGAAVAEVEAFRARLAEWCGERGVTLAPPTPAAEVPTGPIVPALDAVAAAGGFVLVHGVPSLPAPALAGIAAWARGEGRPLFVLRPHTRPATISRRPADAKGAVLLLDGLRDYAAFAEGIASLRSSGWLDGRQTQVVVVDRDPDEAARLFVASLRHRGSDRMREVDLSAVGTSSGAATAEGPGRRILEVLSVARRPLGDRLLREVCAMDPAELARTAADLHAAGQARLWVGRSDEGPAVPQLVLATTPAGPRGVGTERAREIRTVLTEATDTLPGRGVGRSWLQFTAGLETRGGRRVVAAARKLAARAQRLALPFLEFAVHERLQVSQPDLRIEDRCRAAICMGEQYRARGELDTADRIFSDATRALEAEAGALPSRVTPLAVELVLCTARLAGQRNDLDHAERILEQTIERHREDLPVAQRAALYLEHARLLASLPRPREAVARAELALRILSPERHPRETAQAHFLIGNCFYRESRYQDSILNLQRSLGLWEQHGEDLEASRAYNNLSLNYRSMGRLRDAERCLRRSLDLKAKAGDSRLLLGGRLNLGYLALDQGHFDGATECGEECLRLARSLGDRAMEAEAYGLLGEAATGRGEYDEARDLLTRDLALCQEIHLEDERLATLRRLVALQLRQGELDEAARQLEEAREVLVTVPSRYETAMLDLLEAELLQRSGALPPALEAAAAATRGFATLNRFDLQLEALLHRAELERGIEGDAAAALSLREAEDLIARHEIHRVPGRFHTLRAALVGAAPAEPDTPDPWLEGARRLLAAALRGEAGRPELLAVARELLAVDTVLLLEGTKVRATAGRREISAELAGRLAAAGSGRVRHPDGGAVVVPGEPGRWLVALGDRECTDEELDGLELAARGLALTRTPAATPARRNRPKAPPDPAVRILGDSPAMREVRRMIDVVKENDVTILLLGENGTGKDLVARSIHESGPRADRPFVAINCASIPASLLESQLFGHEKGAFTSAHEQHRGVFERAHRGTIFLDEIGEMDLAMQAKLLRVLQEQNFTRVGGAETVQVDVRVIAATNRDLAREVARGAFRTDLYYRLNVITILVPPLRDRDADIDLLAEHFASRFADEFGRPIRGISREALIQLREHDWPGNVRELENVVKSALVFAEGDTLRTEDLPSSVLAGGHAAPRARLEDLVRGLVEAEELTEDRPLMPRLELLLAHEAVRRLGNKTQAARLLGITKPTLYNRLRRFEALYGEGATREEGS